LTPTCEWSGRATDRSTNEGWAPSKLAATKPTNSTETRLPCREKTWKPTLLRGQSISAIAFHLDQDRKTIRAYFSAEGQPGMRASYGLSARCTGPPRLLLTLWPPMKARTITP
jgi:hypothetical protein